MTTKQKQIQSKGQAWISNQSKQGVGHPWAWRPTLDAREDGVQHRPEGMSKQTGLQRMDKTLKQA